MAFQALYAWDMAEKGDKKRTLTDLLELSWLEDDKRQSLGDTADFSRLLISGAVENSEAVDTMIRGHLDRWDFSRLNRVDRALLRLAVYELLYQTAPPTVIIDEAVAISRLYGTDDSYRFINGVLDGVRKAIQLSAEKERP
ncbi:N utilization substance protein B [Spirochaetia bacterium]|nr:N utilization substance protein B [Spirochaetia bacterium]